VKTLNLREGPCAQAERGDEDNDRNDKPSPREGAIVRTT
jgi:hypothetical protein